MTSDLDQIPCEDQADLENLTIWSTGAEENHDSDEEFTVTKILAEEVRYGIRKWLVHWQGYSIKHASFEPLEHFTDLSILEDWSRRKAEEERGNAEPFDVVGWRAAREKRKALRSKLRRVHAERLSEAKSPRKSPAKTHRKRRLVQRSQVSPRDSPPSSAEDNQPLLKRHRSDVIQQSLAASSHGASAVAKKVANDDSSDEEPLSKRTVQPSKKLNDRLENSQNRYSSDVGLGEGDLFSSSSEDNEPLFKRHRPPSSAAPAASRQAPVEISSDDEPLIRRSTQSINESKESSQKPNDSSSSDEGPLINKDCISARGKIDKRSPISGLDPSHAASNRQSKEKPHLTVLPPSSLLPKIKKLDRAYQTNVSSANSPKRMLSTPVNGTLRGTIRNHVFEDNGVLQRRRNNLNEAASDTSKSPKLFSNKRLEYRATIQARNRADGVPNLNDLGGVFDPKLPPSKLDKRFLVSAAPPVLEPTDSLFVDDNAQDDIIGDLNQGSQLVDIGSEQVDKLLAYEQSVAMTSRVPKSPEGQQESLQGNALQHYSEAYYRNADGNYRPKVPETCRYWNRGFCTHSAGTCRYLHHLTGTNSLQQSTATSTKSQQSDMTQSVSKSDSPSNRHGQHSEDQPVQSSGSYASPIVNHIPTLTQRDKPHSPLGAMMHIPLVLSAKTGHEFVATIGCGSSAQKLEIRISGISEKELSKQIPISKSLCFEKICMAIDFQCHGQALIKEMCHEGPIRVPPSAANIKLQDELYDNLRSNACGLVFESAELSILLYPVKCVQWSFISTTMEKFDPATKLRCFIYKPLIKPENCPVVIRDQNSLPDRLKHILFTRSLEDVCRDDHRKVIYRSYFLLMPASALKLAEALCFWIRQIVPDCQIFSSLDHGSWDFFISSSANLSDRALLVHESAVQSLSDLPKFGQLLYSQNIGHGSIWSVGGDSGNSTPLYPSALLEHTASIGKLSLNRLFSTGGVLLLTPSLLVAHPRKALESLKWFRTKLESSIPGKWKIVCPSLKFLHDLALSKSKEHEELYQKHAADSDSLTVEAIASLFKLAAQDCEARFGLCTKFEELQQEHEALLTIKSDAFEVSPLVQPPTSIAVNDEEELVAWFAGWSSSKFDCFRKFIVLASSKVDAPAASCQSSIFARDKTTTFRIPSPTRVVVDKELETRQSQSENEELPTTNTFRFVPTEKWYSELRATGGGWEFLLVDDWRKIRSFLIPRK